jgi:hypothetical protein
MGHVTLAAAQRIIHTSTLRLVFIINEDILKPLKDKVAFIHNSLKPFFSLSFSLSSLKRIFSLLTTLSLDILISSLVD